MTSSSQHPLVPWLFRISAILWVIWGLVHIGAGIATVGFIASGETAEAVHGIASAVELEALSVDYPPAVSAILSQHGFNLGWIGLVTLICAFYVWRGNRLAIYLAALVGGLADLGYFIFVDLGDFALPPGPQMTWICATAIVTSFAALFLRRSSDAT